jgi:hypothetical protein
MLTLVYTDLFSSLERFIVLKDLQQMRDVFHLSLIFSILIPIHQCRMAIVILRNFKSDLKEALQSIILGQVSGSFSGPRCSDIVQLKQPVVDELHSESPNVQNSAQMDFCSRHSARELQ